MNKAVIAQSIDEMMKVSLIATFAMLLTVGYTLNTLSLFGLVPAIGIVVDDAIVVFGNSGRNLAQGTRRSGGCS